MSEKTYKNGLTSRKPMVSLDKLMNNELYDFVNDLIEEQVKFQDLCGADIFTKDTHQQNVNAEIYLMKAIEEIVELRRTQPSGLNPAWKGQGKPIDRDKMIKELADVHFFLLNFMISRGITVLDLLSVIKDVQNRNFEKRLQTLKEIENNHNIISIDKFCECCNIQMHFIGQDLYECFFCLQDCSPENHKPEGDIA